MRPQDVISTYETVGTTWAQHRDKSLMEKAWLDRMLDAAPRTDDKLKILDLGGGSGQPIGTYLAEAGADLTAIEPTKTLSALYAQALPQARVIQTDMRQLDLGERFDCILAWNSFFHLTALDQREMFSTFATH
ncbi:MAG: class I SAM-dependent methyltransferase, partial [Pseudomonadota bacterium]